MKKALLSTARKYQVVERPLGVLSDIVSLLSFFVPAPLILSYLGVIDRSSNSAVPLSFPIRLLILIAGAATLSWGLGAFVTWIMKRNSDGIVVISSIVAVLWGILFVALADGLAVDRSRLPEYEMFVMIGMGLMLWLLAFQFSANVSSGNTQLMVQHRAGMIALFALGSTVAAFVVFVGSVS